VTKILAVQFLYVFLSEELFKNDYLGSEFRVGLIVWSFDRK
jgi:hypothetical protein